LGFIKSQSRFALAHAHSGAAVPEAGVRRNALDLLAREC
jgi:hypothetical protein